MKGTVLYVLLFGYFCAAAQLKADDYNDEWPYLDEDILEDSKQITLGEEDRLSAEMEPIELLNSINADNNEANDYKYDVYEDSVSLGDLEENAEDKELNIQPKDIVNDKLPTKQSEDKSGNSLFENSWEKEDDNKNDEENTVLIKKKLLQEYYDELDNQVAVHEVVPMNELNVTSVNITELKTSDKIGDDTDKNLENHSSDSIKNVDTDFDKIIAETKSILAETDSSDLDQVKFKVTATKQNTEADSSVAKDQQELSQDLTSLYETWNNLTSDNEKEVPEVFKSILNSTIDVIEVDQNDKSIEQFEEVQFETMFVSLEDIKNSSDNTIGSNKPIIPDENTEYKIVEQLSNEISGTENRQINVEDLSSSEFDSLMEQFAEVHARDFEIDRLRDSEPTIIHLNGTEFTTVTSPNYPNNYPTNQIVDWLIEGDGTGIELIISDFIVNGALGDYLLFKPGGVDASGENGIILSYHINSERKFRFLNVNRMFVRFESKLGLAFRKGFSFDVKMIFPPKNDTTDETIPPPPEALLPSAHHSLTINLGGVPYTNFKIIEDDFRILVADMATVYINVNGINIENDTASVTQITGSNFCNINWPGFESCVEVTFSVPVVSSGDEDDWRLNESDLRAMWYTYIYMDPFSSRLKRMGVEEFHLPNDSAALTWWTAAAAAVVATVVVLGIVLWRMSCIESYSRMQIYNEETDMVKEKRPLDLYPTPHQTLPPMYGDVAHGWPKDNVEEYSRVDMPGFTNASFTPDLLDFESDDEPVSQNKYTTEV